MDGGINFDNCNQAKKAGANILVSGSTIFKENQGDLKKNIEILRTN
jgi:ribulose-phosphate 3-epimerase